MSEHPDLAENRTAIKAEITASMDRTFMAEVFNRVSRILQTMIPGRPPVPWYWGACAIALVIWMPAILVPYVFGETNYVSELGWPMVVFFEQTLIFMVLAQVVVVGSLTDIRDHVIDAIECTDDLTDLHRWLMNASAIPKVLTLMLTFGVVWTACVSIYIFILWPTFWGLSAPILGFLYAALLSISVYYLLWFIVLPFRFGHYHFRLYLLDPANSEILARLSKMFNGAAYIAALAGAVGTLMIVSNIVLRGAIVGVIFTAWIPVIVLFIGSETAQRKIVTTARWGTLNELQTKIEMVWRQTDFSAEEPVEELNRLLDLQDRVKATRDSMFDFRAALTLFNQLLLPILALLLSNLDELSDFLP